MYEEIDYFFYNYHKQKITNKSMCGFITKLLVLLMIGLIASYVWMIRQYNDCRKSGYSPTTCTENLVYNTVYHLLPYDIIEQYKYKSRQYGWIFTNY
jgi:hypothetical protein